MIGTHRRIGLFLFVDCWIQKLRSRYFWFNENYHEICAKVIDQRAIIACLDNEYASIHIYY